MNSKLKYVLGIDVGISSVGWGMLELDDNNNPLRIINANSRIFTPGEVPKTGASKAESRRQKRGVRRITRRRELRVDCVRYLLYKNGLLNVSLNEEEPDKQAIELTNYFVKEMENYYKDKDITPYQLKVEALKRKISPIELGIILVHYAKHRGYKSNREDNDSNKLKENGKIKDAISQNDALMKDKKYLTVSEMFIKDDKFSEKIRNASDDYKMSVTREMYLNEINKVLDSQIKFGLINAEFKDEYLTIWSNQRNYAKGPGGNSLYGGNLIEKMTGYCNFTHELRAAKCNPSSELFIAISKLVNLKYKSSNEEDYKFLTSNQIKKIIEQAKQQDKISYANIAKIINIDNIIFKGLDLSKKQYIDFIKKFKTDVLKIDKENKERIDIESLSNEEKEKYYKMLEKSKLSSICFELKTYSLFRKKFTQKDKELWEKAKNNIDMLDNIATLLTNYKLNEDITEQVKKSNVIDDSLAEFIVSLPNCKDHMMLSRSLIVKLNNIMINGVKYNDAMAQLGYTFNDTISDKEKSDLLPSLSSDNQIRNQRVLHSLSQTRKVINAIIKKYGLPKQINIETARELAKTKQERNEIEKNQKERFEKNQLTKEFLVNEFPSVFKTVESITTTDLLKYNLWKEQGELCGYTMNHISIEQLFDKNMVQIDHILPYSRTFNDNYMNKTLVFTKANQDKKNRTPYEWFGKTEKWIEYKNYIESLQIPEKKKENYLLIKLTSEIEDEMRNQNLNDTKYISVFLVSYIKLYLNVDNVQAYPGAITGKLRAMWGLNGLTHSLDSANYRLSKEDRDTFDEIKKNRNTHLHHALDALVIASISPKLELQISRYEKYKRYLQNNTKAGIDYLLSNNLILEDNMNNKFDNKTGELMDNNSLKNYVNVLISKNYLISNKNGKYKFLFPQPYMNFSEEATVFVYEQNIEKKQFFFRNTRKYSNEEIDMMKPLTPSIAKPKLSGRLHGETLYGAKNTIYYGKANNAEEYLTSRIDINSESFKPETLEKMLEKNGGAKEIYTTLKHWITGYDNGSIAFKNNGYPTNPKTGNKIKKIKIMIHYDGKGHFVNGAIVEKDNIYKIGVYKSKDKDINDKRLYFVGYDLLDLSQIKKNKDFIVILWYGQDTNKIKINYFSLIQNYEQKLLLTTNQLVRIRLNNNISGIAYINGFSSGLLEVKSVLGDGKDLYGENKLFNKERSRYQITSSTIKDIELLNITILGDVYGVPTSSNKTVSEA